MESENRGEKKKEESSLWCHFSSAWEELNTLIYSIILAHHSFVILMYTWGNKWTSGLLTCLIGSGLGNHLALGDIWNLGQIRSSRSLWVNWLLNSHITKSCTFPLCESLLTISFPRGWHQKQHLSRTVKIENFLLHSSIFIILNQLPGIYTP